jgi:hypothetical protein
MTENSLATDRRKHAPPTVGSLSIVKILTVRSHLTCLFGVISWELGWHEYWVVESRETPDESVSRLRFAVVAREIWLWSAFLCGWFSVGSFETTTFSRH